MDAWIYDAEGRSRYLPVLLRWEFSYGFCSPCDCFEVSFLYSPEMLEPLKAACRFRAAWDGKCVFSGVVDEVELRADRTGCTAVLRGRGMQALLLDSEAESAEYTGADAAFILSRHVQPFGITAEELSAEARGKRASLSVRSGESHWSVVSRFAEFCLGLQPRFDPEGRLLLDGGDSGTRLRLDGTGALTEERLVQDRYGVLSGVIVKNRAAGSSVTVENVPFKAIGGSCIKVLNVPRYTGFDAMRHTGEYQIEKSQAGLLRWRITLPQCFAAFPGDRVTAVQTPLGVRGEFTVESSRSFADGTGAGTVLEMRPVR